MAIDYRLDTIAKLKQVFSEMAENECALIGTIRCHSCGNTHRGIVTIPDWAHSSGLLECHACGEMNGVFVYDASFRRIISTRQEREGWELQPGEALNKVGPQTLQLVPSNELQDDQRDKQPKQDHSIWTLLRQASAQIDQWPADKQSSVREWILRNSPMQTEPPTLDNKVPLDYEQQAMVQDLQRLLDRAKAGKLDVFLYATIALESSTAPDEASPKLYCAWRTHLSGPSLVALGLAQKLVQHVSGLEAP